MTIDVQSNAAPVTFELGRQKGRAKTKVTARVGNELVHVDMVNLGDAKARVRFAEVVARKCGGTTDDLDQRLMEIAATPEPEAAPKGDAKTEGLRQLDKASDAALKDTPEHVLRAAQDMLAAPALLDIVVGDIHALGVAGEDDLIAGLSLCFTSRLLDDPVSCKVQGTSSSGKSYITRKVGDTIPPESVFIATDITANALYYMQPGCLVHRLVLAGEKSRVQDDQAAEATRALREMISEGRLSKAVPVKVDGGLQTLRFEQPGPIVHCESTTLADLFDEDANRCVLLATDESAAQTKKVLAMHAARAKGVKSDPAPILDKHHAAQRMLRRLRVEVPFADNLAAAMPMHRSQVRRAFGQLIAMTRSSALWHQFQRSTKPLEHGDTIQATWNDYAIARHVLLRPLARGLGTALPDAVRRFGEWLLLFEGGRSEGPDASASFTNRDLGKAPHCPINSRGTRHRYLEKLADSGFVIARKSDNGTSYQLAMAEVPDSDAGKWLPTVESLK